MQIIDGRQISEKIFFRLKQEFSALSFKPKVYDILVGVDAVSVSYVNIKARAALRLGLDFEILNLDLNISQTELEAEILKINKEPRVCGIVLQLPLPKTLDPEKALNAIDPELDVDSMGKTNLDKFYKGVSEFVPPTVSAIWEILSGLAVDLNTKNILVIGQGQLVGKPVSFFLKSKGLQVNIADSETKEVVFLAKKADIIISATGRPGLIKKEYINPGAVVIDAGTSESSGAIVGDVDFEDVSNVAGYLTPVPGGVGPVTVAMLYTNVAIAAKKKNYAKN